MKERIIIQNMPAVENDEQKRHLIRYINFINSRSSKNKVRGLAEHHIYPRSLGGLDIKENLIVLTPREHFIAHLILWKTYGGCMTTAFFRMQYDVHNKNAKITSKQYNRLVHDFSERQAIRNSGKNNAMYGKNAYANKTEEEMLIISKKKSIAFSGKNNPMYGRSSLENKTEKEIKEIANKKRNTWANKSEEEKEAYSKKQSNYMWITNGKENKKISLDSNIPVGWYKDRVLDVGNDFKEKISNLQKDTIYINNGIETKRIKKWLEIPEGWTRGRILRKKQNGK